MSSVVCEGALGTIIKQGPLSYKVTFNTSSLVGVTAGNQVTFTVTAFGEYRGDEVAFEGSANVNVTP